MYEIKALVKQMNSPSIPYFILLFILKFEPFLEQTTQNFKLKKESDDRLKQHIDVMTQQWT